ncbi:MAG: AEC family transporter [Deltaproteobacteria bacterium]|nr:AEC family transporter [Deltaproteobacteria bacterium]MBW1914581.1 AEC family transporter [Deltaproteobacteria bacterium]
MELAVIFNTSILPLFIIVAIAFVYNRICHPDISQITNLAINVFGPIFIFSSVIKFNITLLSLIKPVIFMTLLTSIMIALAHLIARSIRATEDERVSFILACSMVNVGNFGLPLIYFAFGKNAEAYSILYFAAFSIPLSTVAIYISSKEINFSKIMIDMARIPIFHAMVIALILSGMSINIPGPISKSLNLLSQATIPLLIFILGIQLSKMKFTMSHAKFIPLALGLRLIISPAVACLILAMISVTGLEKQVAMIQTSTPSALLPLMYAIRFNRSPDLLAAIILVSTVVSGITLTLLIKTIS